MILELKKVNSKRRFLVYDYRNDKYGKLFIIQYTMFIDYWEYVAVQIKDDELDQIIILEEVKC